MQERSPRKTADQHPGHTEEAGDAELNEDLENGIVRLVADEFWGQETIVVRTVPEQGGSQDVL